MKNLTNLTKTELINIIDGLETEGITLRRENERLTIQNEALMNALKAVNTGNTADKIDKNVAVKLNAPTLDDINADGINADDSNTDGKKKTYAEAINDWKIKKYGSIEIADAVAAMTNVVAKEWADTARKTGKYVVSKRNYKNKLYAEAYLRVLIKNKADKKMIEAQRKVVNGLK